jgi:predicted ATPase
VEAELLYQRGLLPQAIYLFKHALIQDAAYQSLLKSTRQQYHQRIAQVLEARFPETAETQPELLAQHYTEAGENEVASSYWQQAGEVAKQRSAYTEAIHHFTKGMEVVNTLPETPARHLLELDLRIALGPELMAAKGYSSPEVEHSYTRARELCQQVGETPQLFPALWGLWVFSGVKGEYHTALDLAEQLLRLAQRFQDPALLLQAHHAMWMTLFHHGDLTSVRAHCQQGNQLYESDQHHAQTYVYGNHDPGVCARGFGCRTLWLLGYPDQARQMCGDMLTLARQLKHPLSLVQAHAWATWVHVFCGEYQLALAQAEATVARAAEQGIPYWTSQGTMLRGWLHAAAGEVEAGLTQIHQGLEAFQAIRAGSLSPWYVSLLAKTHGKQGQIDLGLRAIAFGLDAVNQRELFVCESELYRLKGELLLQQSPDNQTEAETCFRKAITIAQNQQAKSLELRAATSLARLWQSQGKR